MNNSDKSKIGGLSVQASCLYFGAWTIADDEGLLLLTPPYIKSEIFPCDRIDIDVLELCIAEIIDSGLMIRYFSRQKEPVGWIVNFRKHQKTKDNQT